MNEILQSALPYDVTARGLPGIAPLDPADWLVRDEAFAAQMGLRRRLLTENRADVLALTPKGGPAAAELSHLVLDWLARHGAGYVIRADRVTRPDGVVIPLDCDDPLGTLGQLVQEDFCLLEKHGQEHVMTGAVLCFPASWRLADKIGRPLTTIHDPVDEYDDGLARRVQRLFDGVQVDRPLWRFNYLHYADAALHQPTPRAAPERDTTPLPYIRSERQCVLRLPETRACVFSIHTFVLKRPTAQGVVPVLSG